MQKEPLDGVVVTLPDDGDLFHWHVGIFGPPDTLFTGGYFKVKTTRWSRASQAAKPGMVKAARHWRTGSRGSCGVRETAAQTAQGDRT